MGLMRAELATFAGDKAITGSLQVGGPRPWIDVRAYGALGDGTTDDTTAIQAAINAAKNTVSFTGGILFVPPGVYKITDTLTVSNVSGFQLWGSGASDNFNQCTFEWAGAADRTMFLMQDCSRCCFRDFRVKSSPSLPLLVGIRSENGPGAITPKSNRYDNVHMDGGNNGGLLKAGWYHAQGAGGDANNDFSSFFKCSVQNYDNCGWLFYHSQSKGHRFQDCDARAANANTQAIGVSAGNDVHAGTSVNGGGFHWYGGTMSRNLTADFYIGTPNDSVIIDGVNSENSARFIVVGGPTAALMPLAIRGVRWAHAGNLAADKFFCNISHPGPVVIEASKFEDQSPGNAMQIRFNPSPAQRGQIALIGNHIESTASDLVSLGQVAGVRQIGNTGYNRATSTATNWQDELEALYTLRTVSAHYTASIRDKIILVDASAAARTITLPTAVGFARYAYTVKKIDASVNAVTIDPTGAETIDGLATLALSSQWAGVTVVSDGANWLVQQSGGTISGSTAAGFVDISMWGVD
jgi:hypothetical protein